MNNPTYDTTISVRAMSCIAPSWPCGTTYPFT